MSKVKNPLVSLGAKGDLGKLFTFVKRRRRAIVEKKPIPFDPQSATQLSWRHMFLKVVALWHALPPAEQQEWESNARPRHLTGYQWFVSQALRPNPGIYLPLQGGTMSGNIDMAKNRILRLPTPIDLQEPATRAYVDQALENLMWAKFLNDTPSGIGAYFEMAPDPTGEAKSTFTSGVLDTGDDQALFQWISDAVVTFTTIKTGVIRVHIHAQRIAGNKSIQLYAEIYEYTQAAAEILITTTELCDFLTDDEQCIEIHAPLADDYEIAPTSKLLIKFLANVGAAGANVTVNLYAEGATTSSVSLPIPTSPLIDAEIAFHASIVDAHHARYTDGEADARIAIHAAIAAAHHARYTNGEADARIAIHAAVSDAHHTPAVATKEFFAALPYGWTYLGDFGVDRALDGGGRAEVNFRVPHDFTSITSAHLIVISNETKVDYNFDIDSDYGADGEPYNNHSEADAATTYNLTANQFYYLDISGILSALAAGDTVGIALTNNEAANSQILYLLGIRFKYT